MGVHCSDFIPHLSYVLRDFNQDRLKGIDIVPQKEFMFSLLISFWAYLSITLQRSNTGCSLILLQIQSFSGTSNNSYTGLGYSSKYLHLTILTIML